MNLVVFLTAILFYLAGAPAILAADTQRPFAAFDVKVEIDIEDGEIEIAATFRLVAGSGGLDLAKKAISLELKGGAGAYSVTLPPGSFKKDESGEFHFQGTIKRVRLAASIRPLASGAFEFEAETEGANLRGFANPVTVSLAIGDDGGSKTVPAKIE